jgi:hypothetical protein
MRNEKISIAPEDIDLNDPTTQAEEHAMATVTTIL